MQATAWEPEGVESLLDASGGLSDPAAISGLDLRDYYKKLVAARILDLKLSRLELPMWASSSGEEAVAVAVGSLVAPHDWVYVGNRDAAVALTRGVPLTELIRQALGRPDAETRGRGLPGSIASTELRIAGACEPLGMSLALAVGQAHGQKLFGRGRATLALFGEGATTTGMFHEALVLALAHDAPVVFVCKSQVWPEGAPAEAGLLGDSVADRARSLGLWTRRCDGADVLGVHRSLAAALHRAHDGTGPALVEIVVTPMQQDPPAERDPVERMRRLLDKRSEWSQPFQDVIEAELHGQFDKALAQVTSQGIA